MAITNYRASGKTRVPFCGGDCCGTKFGRIHTHHALRPQSAAPKRKMRRYARHADKRFWRREVEMEVQLLTAWEYDAIECEQDIYYRQAFEDSLMDDYDDGSDYDDYRDSFYDSDYDMHDDIYCAGNHPQHNLLMEIQRAYNSRAISYTKYRALIMALNKSDF